ncbi:MAG: hypothetical protein V4543_02725 [Bacteroidota bacterium]
MPVIIDFDNTYEPNWYSDDLTAMSFMSPLADGTSCIVLVLLARHENRHLADVFNIGFGPPNELGGFIDNVKLRHSDLNKVLSTVLFHGFLFLRRNQDFTIGIDGSDDIRARLYHSAIKQNREYICRYFIPLGVDWYVRITRQGNFEKDSEGNLVPKSMLESFDFKRNSRDLYNYYMFSLKENVIDSL